MKFDMHCHTREGSVDGKVPVAKYIDILIKKGFDGMLISDHNSYKGYEAWKENDCPGRERNFTVLKGIEYDTVDAGHMLVIMPEDIDLGILRLRGLPVRLLIEIVHGNGGIIGPAHPCGEKYLSILNTKKHRNRLAVMDKFDFLEGFNACEGNESNERAMGIADSLGLAAFGGSDAHKEDCVGLGYTEFAKEIRSESDLIELVKSKKSGACTCGGVHYAHTTRERIGKVKDIFLGSFWFYNRFASICNSGRRRRELKRLYIRLK